MRHGRLSRGGVPALEPREVPVADRGCLLRAEAAARHTHPLAQVTPCAPFRPSGAGQPHPRHGRPTSSHGCRQKARMQRSSTASVTFPCICRKKGSFPCIRQPQHDTFPASVKTEACFPASVDTGRPPGSHSAASVGGSRSFRRAGHRPSTAPWVEHQPSTSARGATPGIWPLSNTLLVGHRPSDAPWVGHPPTGLTLGRPGLSKRGKKSAFTVKVTPGRPGLSLSGLTTQIWSTRSAQWRGGPGIRISPPSRQALSPPVRKSAS